MRTTVLGALVAAGLLAVGAAPASSATLLGQTINADIQIIGADDFGLYTINVLSGPITIGASGYSTDISVFRQLTEGGYSTPSNQIVGDVAVNITDGAVSVTMNGQVQPFELESKFSGISGPIVADADSATGTIPGVNMDLFSSYTANSLDFATYYLGYQTGTSVTQTETLTFGTGRGVPEPSTWALMLLGVGVLGAAVRRARRLGGEPLAAAPV